jgi:hypothetical protein
LATNASAAAAARGAAVHDAAMTVATAAARSEVPVAM